MAIEDQINRWAWQKRQYTKGKDPNDEWRKKRASGQISDLENQYIDPKKVGGLVLILAGAVCNIWDFFLVHSYARVGLYLCSTATYCRPALKNKKLKKSLLYGYNKNSYRPILWKI
jgi:hypothetical protein